MLQKNGSRKNQQSEFYIDVVCAIHTNTCEGIFTRVLTANG